MFAPMHRTCTASHALRLLLVPTHNSRTPLARPRSKLLDNGEGDDHEVANWDQLRDPSVEVSGQRGRRTQGRFDA